MWVCVSIILAALFAFSGLTPARAQVTDTAPSETDWHITAGNDHWTAPTATAGGGEFRARIEITCGGDGRPVMAVSQENYPEFDAQTTTPAEIDGQTFTITWTGWKIFAVSNPDYAVLNLMRSGQKMIIYGEDGPSMDFDLSGAQQVIDTALTPCVERQAAVSEAVISEMRAKLVAKVTEEMQAICAADGGKAAQIAQGAIKDNLRLNSPVPDVLVDFSLVKCAGDALPGAGFCDAVSCLHRRYSPDSGAYALDDIYLQ